MYKAENQLATLKHGAIKPVKMTEGELESIIEATVALKTVSKNGNKSNARNVPKSLLKRMIKCPPESIRQLDYVSDIPIFLEGGKLGTTPGYYEEMKAYYLPPPDLANLTIPQAVSTEDMQRCAEFIFNELLCDFPFHSCNRRLKSAAGCGAV